jgi:hypothetical protein
MAREEYLDTDYFSRTGMDLYGNRRNDGSMQGGRNNSYTSSSDIISPDWEDEEVDWLKKAALKRDEATEDSERDTKSMVDKWLSDGMKSSDLSDLQGVMKSLVDSMNSDNKKEDEDRTGDLMKNVMSIYAGMSG